MPIKGWMSGEELAWLTKQAQGCKTILELGCYRGRSTLALLDGNDAHLWCVDTWAGSVGNLVTEDDYEAFITNIADVRERITIWRTMTQTATRYWEKERASFFDLVFVDANHAYEAVRADILACLPLVTPGGLLCGHDYDAARWPGVKQTVNELFERVGRIGTIWWTRWPVSWSD